MREQEPGNGWGATRITYQSIQAWIAGTGVDPTPWEIETIVQVDRAYLRYERSKQKDGAAES